MCVFIAREIHLHPAVVNRLISFIVVGALFDFAVCASTYLIRRIKCWRLDYWVSGAKSSTKPLEPASTEIFRVSCDRRHPYVHERQLVILGVPGAWTMLYTPAACEVCIYICISIQFADSKAVEIFTLSERKRGARHDLSPLTTCPRSPRFPPYHTTPPHTTNSTNNSNAECFSLPLLRGTYLDGQTCAT